MSKNIVVLTGSPRKNGNSFAMTDAFVKACEEKGYHVTRFDTAFMNIKCCTACNACYTDDKPCVHDDDFNQVAAAIEEADSVVFTCPVYWYSIPSNLKAVIDKFYAFSQGDRLNDIAGKKTALITCWEETDLDVGDGVKYAYRKSMLYLGWKSIGEVGVYGVGKRGDIRKTEGVARAVKLADLI